jgi:hypothetical protein
LARIRADTPPTGVIDLLDRTIARIGSGHWTIRQSGHLIAITTIIMLGAALVVLSLTDRLTPLASSALTAHGPACLTGGALIAATGYAIRRMRRHRALRQ